ncbi:MAG: aminotransferase class V-fold PLP-dependent enzyme, partial [Chloroflexi bacterium]|nr:aminotransferase class V-fold PLP-dependent enzyme [Chloroflexota bacterium]
VEALNVDLLAISGHKIYAPKGIGILYVRKNMPVLSPFTGGGHENNRRPGTENVPYIVGIAKAMELIQTYSQIEKDRQMALRDRLITGVLQTISNSQLTGHPTRRLANHASFVFEGGEADGILMHLDMAGVQAASGSACTTGMPEPSHVLTAMGIPHDLALSALRLTVGRQTSEADIDAILEILPRVIEKVRQLNPAYEPAF